MCQCAHKRSVNDVVDKTKFERRRSTIIRAHLASASRPTARCDLWRVRVPFEGNSVRLGKRRFFFCRFLFCFVFAYCTIVAVRRACMTVMTTGGGGGRGRGAETCGAVDNITFRRLSVSLALSVCRFYYAEQIREQLAETGLKTIVFASNQERHNRSY